VGIIGQLGMPLALSVLLSAVLFAGSRRYPAATWGLALIWLPALVWIVGWPHILPTEATQWLWLLVTVTVGLGILATHRQTAFLVQSVSLLLFLLIIAWPVVHTLADNAVLVELGITLSVGILVIYRLLMEQGNNRKSPVLALAVSLGGLSITAALAGSVMVGQLVGALSACLGAFAIMELMHGCREQSVDGASLVPVVVLALVLLAIARIYTEMPIGPSALLLLAIPAGLLLQFRFAFLASLLCAVIALSWLLLTADSSSYY